MVKVAHLVIVPPEGIDYFVVIEGDGLTILEDDLVVVPVVWFVRCLLKESSLVIQAAPLLHKS